MGDDNVQCRHRRKVEQRVAAGGGGRRVRGHKRVRRAASAERRGSRRERAKSRGPGTHAVPQWVKEISRHTSYLEPRPACHSPRQQREQVDGLPVWPLGQQPGVELADVCNRQRRAGGGAQAAVNACSHTCAWNRALTPPAVNLAASLAHRGRLPWCDRTGSAPTHATQLCQTTPKQHPNTAHKSPA